MKIFKYIQFINENYKFKKIPTYDECVEICSQPESPFYETKLMVDGFPISLFNYRLAKYSDFITPISNKPELSALELRGLCFVFNNDGSLYNRYILLEKFFNLNQVPNSMYSDVKDLTIKSISNKEDGSIASFIKLPNGKVIGKSKMGFENEQSSGINRVYKTNTDIKRFVDWSINNNIISIWEYVSPTNRIVLRYDKEELILLRLRKNTGEHLDIKNYLDKLGSIRIAPFEDENSLDDLIEKSKTETGREGWIITFKNGKMIKIKTSEYISLHGLLTDDIYREHVIISYILDDKIDDILGQIPEEQHEAHERINKIIGIVKRELANKTNSIKKAYNDFLNMNISKKDYALNHRSGNDYFSFVMNMDKGNVLKNMTQEEILSVYDNMDYYNRALNSFDPYEMAKAWLRDKTKRLNIARAWLKEKDPTLFFQEPDENTDN